jgi:hypothetical protein
LPAFHIGFTPVIFQDRAARIGVSWFFAKQVGGIVTSANAALLACGTCNFSLQCSKRELQQNIA